MRNKITYIKNKIKSIKNKIIFMKIFLFSSVFVAITNITVYHLTDHLPEKFPGADYYFNIIVQISVSIISSFIFYIFIDFIPRYMNINKSLENIKYPLIKICYMADAMYKDILNENSSQALRFNYIDPEDFKNNFLKNDILKLKPIATLFIGDGEVIFNNVPIAFSIIMQIKNIQINIDKILKQKFLEHSLEEILINMLNSGVMDLAALMNNHICLKNLTPYKVFEKCSKQNQKSYYNFLIYSIKIQKYCYENDFFAEEQLNRLELK